MRHRVALKRRAKKRNQSPKLTPVQQSHIQLYYKVCRWLGSHLFHVDHIHPIAKGGLDHPGNLQILTKKDNLEKGCKLDFHISENRILRLPEPILEEPVLLERAA